MKNKYKKKALCILLALALVFTLTPAIPGAVENAYAADPGISITGSTADSSGTGWSYVKSTKTLTLTNYNGGYIQGSGLNTLNLVLEGTNTITVNDENAKGITLGNNQNLNISGSGSGSLTINATGGSNLIYGIECNKFTMTSGTVTINANSSKMVYGVNANDSLSVTGGKLTANITGTTDGRGLYCKTGKLTVDSGAEVAVKVTNNGSSIMYGIYNEANTASVTDNGDIALAGTVTVTRDSGSTGTVYGIANGGSGGNTDGVISITGGTVTVTDANYGIIAFTKGQAAFADVDISDGTVNITSTTSDSLGIVSWNNGVTISGGTVTASTASKALWLADDSANNGLVKITGDAKVSLTSTDYKALVVQGDESNTSTRVHQINLTSGGSVTVKSTEGSYYAFPVQGYFNLGSSTEITEGSFRAVDGTNAGGGKLFVADSTTKQVVVAYSTPAPDANSVSVNGHNFANPTKLYYKNGYSDTGNGSTDYNAHYDPATGVLELKNYNSGPIMIGGSVESDITIRLVGDNVITSDSQFGIVNNNGGDITITAGSDATLIINVTNDSNYAFGIACDIPGSYTSRSRAITISGKANVTVNATATSTEYSKNAVGISTKGTVAIKEDASFKAVCKSSTPSTGLQSAAGIYGYSGVTINTTGKVDIDISQCSGAYNYGIYGNASNNLTKVVEMTIKWKQSSGNGAHVLDVGSFNSAAATHAINVDTTNCVATYRYGTPYTVTVNNGSCDAANSQYLEGDTITVTANTISGLTFKKWTSADVTVASETSAETTFTMPAKAVTVTANYNLFTTEPSFARTSDTEGTISFTLAATPSSVPKLVEKDSDTVVGNQFFSGSNLERSNTVTDGIGTYNVPSGEYRIAVQYGGVWFYSDVFTVDYTAVTGPSAKVGNVTVSGTTDTAIDNTDVIITLTNDKFKAIAIGTDVTSWFTNLPNGLKAKVKTAVNADDTTATITVSGTPTATSTAQMAITIPAAQLVTSDSNLTVTANANAKFNISAPATYTVTINAGANMTLASGSANQSGLSGAMTDTVYTAADGYYFPTDYAVAAVNGISVTRNSYTQITVSGTPTANTTITLTQATAKTLSSIAVTTAPTKVTYTAGEYFNTSGMVVTATYSDSSTKAVTSYTFAPTEALTTGDTSITISYTEGGVTKTATQAITVNAATKTLSSIAVTTAPTKVTYTAGEYFNTSGMVVTATYSDSSTKAVTSYTFAPTEALTTGDTSITISYTEGGVTKTATQAITVNAATKTLSSIAVTTAPTKVTYTAGEYFNTSGMVVTATYSDSSTKAVTSYTFAPTEALTTGDTSITISYTEGGVTKTATQTITVNAKPISGGGYIPTVQKPTIDAGEGVKVTLSTDGTVATITVEAGYDLADVVLNGTSKGKVTEVKGLKTGDKLVVTAAKKATEPTREDILATLADQKLVARSKVVTMKNGKKAVRITWYNQNGEMMEFDGVQIYRSTKKNSGYGKKPIFTSETDKYYNTAVKAGTKYYYKVRGFVVIDGQKYYTDWSLKAIRTVK